MKGAELVILLVEDSEEHAELTLRSIRQQRVANRIIHVSDGQEALDYLYREGKYNDSDQYPMPHCLLLDLRMPRVDGLEVLRRIKSDADLKHIRVAVLSTSSAEKDLATAEDYHADSYLVKPLDADMFGALMEELGFYWLLWKKFPED